MISATMILLIGAALLFMAVVHIESPNVTRPIEPWMTELQVKRINVGRRLHSRCLIVAGCSLIGALIVAIGSGASPDFMALTPLLAVLAGLLLVAALSTLFYIKKYPAC